MGLGRPRIPVGVQPTPDSWAGPTSVHPDWRWVWDGRLASAFPMWEGAGTPYVYDPSGRPWTWLNSEQTPTMRWTTDLTSVDGLWNTIPGDNFVTVPWTPWTVNSWPYLLSGDSFPFYPSWHTWTDAGNEAFSFFQAGISGRSNGNFMPRMGFDHKTGGADDTGNVVAVAASGADDIRFSSNAGSDDPDLVNIPDFTWFDWAYIRPEGALATTTWLHQGGAKFGGVTQNGTAVAHQKSAVANGLTGHNISFVSRDPDQGASVGQPIGVAHYLFDTEIPVGGMEMLHADPWGPFRSYRRIFTAAAPPVTAAPRRHLAMMGVGR